MNLRAKLAGQAAPFLEHDEQLQAAFRAQSSFNIREARLTRCPMWHLIAVTNRAILILDLSMLTCRPTRVRLRCDRNVYFGRSRRFFFGNQTYWVSRDFDDQIAAADAALVAILRWGDHLVEEVKLAGHDQSTMRTVPPEQPMRQPPASH